MDQAYKTDELSTADLELSTAELEEVAGGFVELWVRMAVSHYTLYKAIEAALK